MTILLFLDFRLTPGLLHRPHATPDTDPTPKASPAARQTNARPLVGLSVVMNVLSSTSSAFLRGGMAVRLGVQRSPRNSAPPSAAPSGEVPLQR